MVMTKCKTHGLARCRTCTPQYFCHIHTTKSGLARRKDQCKDCGTGYCEPHGIQKSICLECGGGGLCEAHQIIRSLCLECGGGSLCGHHIMRSRCRECSGCIHGVLRSLCPKEGCGGTALCEPHRRRKDQCVECDGNAICDHRIRRVTCVQCDYLIQC